MSESQNISRKLAAIMFTDIAGYTALSSKDETKALKLLDTQKQILTPIIEGFNGTLHKEIGDGLLFTFPTVTEAVNCGIKIQEAIKTVDDLNLRIGIHEGEITLKDGDVLGDDVNVASRIEPFSSIGGIAVSGKVQQNISSLTEFKTKFIGKPNLKGVSQEVKLYCITSHGLPETEISKVSAKLDKETSQNSIFKFTGAVLTVLGIVFWVAVGIFDISFGNKNLPPSIGILMIDNIGSEDDEFWARGITEDLIVKVAGAGLIRVASMKEVLEIDMKQSFEEIANTLRVKYLLTSSLHKRSGGFDLRSQLIEVESGNSKYANKWSEKLDNAPKIIGKLASDLLKTLKVSTNQNIMKVQTANFDAYEYYLRGKYKFDKSKNLEDISIAKGLLEEAIKLDKNLIIAQNKLGNVLLSSGDSYGAMEVYFEALRQSEVLEDKRNTSMALNNIGMVLWRRGDYDQALVYFQKSLHISKEMGDKKGSASSLRLCGIVSYAKGDYKKELEYLEKSHELHKRLNDKRSMISYYNSQSLAFNKMGKYSKAIKFNKQYFDLSKELESYSNISNALHVKGMIYVLQKKYDKAIIALKECVSMRKEHFYGYSLEPNTLLALSQKNLKQKFDITEIEIMVRDTQSEKVHAGSRIKGIDFDLNLWLFQLLEENSYIEAAYMQIQELAENLEPKLRVEFLSYPIPKTIIDEWKKHN